MIIHRFKDGDIKDLIRDVPKLCSLNGSCIIFGGACFLSILNDINHIHVYDKEEDNGMKLITNQVPNGFTYDSWIPVKICQSKNITQWITDYIPFKNKCILSRWQGKLGKPMYGIWELMNNEWKCVKTNEYNDMIWNNSILSCYHFGDRLKTILLSIQLQNL